MRVHRFVKHISKYVTSYDVLVITFVLVAFSRKSCVVTVVKFISLIGVCF